IDGASLRSVLATGEMPGPRALLLAASVAETLAQLHRVGVVHKDVKPANLLFAPGEERLILVDFGIARGRRASHPDTHAPETLEGTLAYIAPEQTGRMNRGVDHRADLYSLGVTLYEMLTGQLPFVFSDAMELVHAHLARVPVAPSRLAPGV